MVYADDDAELQTQNPTLPDRQTDRSISQIHASNAPPPV
jgi:hypothetical protein